MAQIFTLPALGASLMLGAIGGLHLGESAVDLIDPIHFQGPAVHPRDRGAAISEQAIPPASPSFASHYGWEEGNAARLADCGGCDALAARDVYAYPAAYVEPVEVVTYGWEQSRPEPEERVEEIREEHLAAWKEDVGPYTDYPIEAVEEEAGKPAARADLAYQE